MSAAPRVGTPSSARRARRSPPASVAGASTSALPAASIAPVTTSSTPSPGSEAAGNRNGRLPVE